MRAQQMGSPGISREIRSFVPPGAMRGFALAERAGPPSPEDQLVRLGKTIRAVRKASGLSQEDLAYEAEIDYSTMGEIERGQRNATLVKLMRIATALNKSMADLFAGAEI
jgi:DNA-binding XRE family transcriptional regulator